MTSHAALLALILALALQIAPVLAESDRSKAVMLVAEQQRNVEASRVLEALVESFTALLTADDRIGLVLYSEVIDVVEPLAPPGRVDLSDYLEDATDRSPDAPRNGTVGVERALAELGGIEAERFLITVGDLSVVLDDPARESDYELWLHSLLLPQAEDQGVRILVFAGDGMSAGTREALDSMPLAERASLAIPEPTAAAMTFLARDTTSVPSVDDTGSVGSGESVSAASPTSTVSKIAEDRDVSDRAETSTVETAAKATASTSATDSTAATAESAATAASNRFASLATVPAIAALALAILIAVAGVVFFLRPRHGRHAPSTGGVDDTVPDPDAVTRPAPPMARTRRRSPPASEPSVDPEQPANQDIPDDQYSDMADALEDLTRERQKHYKFD